MITTITLNPALDRTIHIHSIKYGEVNRVGEIREDLGGKGINVGRILSGFTLPTMNMTILGQSNYHEILEYFKKDEMAVNYVEVPGHTRTNIKIVEKDLNRTIDLNESGLSVDSKNYEKFLEKLDAIAPKSEYLIMSGSLPEGLPKDTYKEIANRYGKQVKIIIDADDDVLSEGLKGEPYLIKPNIHELENALNRKLESDVEIIEAAREIIKRYKMTYVLVSMGAKGSLLVSAEEAYRGGTIDVDIISTVGAGDAMLAGFIYGLSRKKPLNDCLAIAAACSALTISVEGYPRLDLDDVYDRARQVTVTKL
ncbi:Tagatose-6-phosphate kinase [Petrocella atlantisensis]|uniref:Tagatose-6-phosphate kinase n=1 Tax=Petrocella atlantisensis TaxID=2173034 RepID=A0A3P7PX21_9FIRM|nr:1-phosphofructokinase [Petrocella atlantisensis]VDN48227.1 Tagatose-6-phosphate kinase [Petrocella atlantisensis]